MTEQAKVTKPAFCRVTTANSGAAGWRIHRRLVIFPAEILNRETAVSLEQGGVRVKGEVVLVSRRMGLALAWHRADLPGVPLGMVAGGASTADGWQVPALTEQPDWTVGLAGHETGPIWSFDAQIHLVAYIVPDPDGGRCWPLGDLFTPEFLSAVDAEGMTAVWECPPCGVLVATGERNMRCRKCGQAMVSLEPPPSDPDPSALLVESILEAMEEDPVLCRIGPMAWTVRKGSARMDLLYTDSGLCVDVRLVKVRSGTDRAGLFAYLLRENARLTDFGFSLAGDTVMISLLLPGRILKTRPTARLLLDLIEKSDEYDNRLVSVFGAEWL